MKTSTYIESARKTFRIEQAALDATLNSLNNEEFAHACDVILTRTGRVVVTGVGKSGQIGRKIASTLSSTGTPSLFLHASEAAHGDLGFVNSDDTVVMLSKSGESDELTTILPALASKHIPIIAITAYENSRIGKAAKTSGGALLQISIPEEACPHDLAPTSSTTAQLVIGDALAIALLDARKFTSDDFAKLHPAGALGRKLTMTVGDLMVSGDDIPLVFVETALSEVMHVISSKRLGAACVVDNTKTLVGIITDGDLRRFLQSKQVIDITSITANDLMTQSPKTITADILAIDALRLMQNNDRKVMHLPVLSNDKMVEGIIHIHDIVRAGITLV